MPHDLDVDTDALRRCATELAGTSDRVAGGMAQAPPLVVASFGWATARAADELETAADRRLRTLAGVITQTARQVDAAADGYEAADARAATRLREIR